MSEPSDRSPLRRLGLLVLGIVLLVFVVLELATGKALVVEKEATAGHPKVTAWVTRTEDPVFYYWEVLAEAGVGVYLIYGALAAGRRE